MTALAATLDAMKVAPEVAATGIKNLILGLTAGEAATKKQKEAFHGLGIDTVKLAGVMQKDAPAAIIRVLEAIKRLPKARQLSMLQQIFGRESLGAIAPLLDNLDLVRQNLKISADTTAYAGAMQKEFKNRSRTTANALRLAGNRAAELGINLGAVALPAIVSVLDTINPYTSALAEMAGQHQGVTTAVFATVAGLVALKVGGLAVAYTGTLVSDAWILAKGVFAGARVVIAACTSGLVTQRAATMAAAVTSRAHVVAVRAMAAAQWLFNAALWANPITWVVAGVAALASGLVWLYQTCEPVRTAIDGVWTAVRDVGISTWDAITGAIRIAWDEVVGFFDTVADKFQWVTEAWSSVAQWLPAGIGVESPMGEAAGRQVRPNIAAPAVTTAAAHRTTSVAAAAQSAPSVSAAPSAPTLPRLTGAAAGSITVQAQLSMPITIQGVPSKDIGEILVGAIKSKDRELTGYFEKMIAGIASNQRRLAYDQ